MAGERVGVDYFDLPQLDECVCSRLMVEGDIAQLSCVIKRNSEMVSWHDLEEFTMYPCTNPELLLLVTQDSGGGKVVGRVTLMKMGDFRCNVAPELISLAQREGIGEIELALKRCLEVDGAVVYGMDRTNFATLLADFRREGLDLRNPLNI